MMHKIQSILFVVILIGGFCFCSYYEHHYTRENCIVTQVNNSCITVKDKCGFYWDFEDEGFNKGDKVTLKMFDNCTNSYIEDDEIVKVIRINE